ncbi:MAG: hypothetical protein AAFZ65_06440 [Planctomycetota bacterium]
MTSLNRNRDRALAFFASLSLSLLTAFGLLVAKYGSPFPAARADAGDPSAEGEAIARLVDSIASVFDTHPDPDVSRVLAPRLKDVRFHGSTVSSNSRGMRDRDYALPKHKGIYRVVLLGDSYVFGLGSEAEERFGVLLEQELTERAQWRRPKKVEVLHIGIGSWNTKAECAYLLRHLTPLDPDLVVQVFVSNDLDDNIGARGFGTRSNFDPGRPRRTHGRVYSGFPAQVHGTKSSSPVLMGLDYESRSRYEEAVAWVGRLAGALEQRGTPFVFFSTMGGGYGKVVLEQFGPVVGEERFLFADTEFMGDLRYRISKSDGHWNVEGNRRVAELLYGCIVERDLAPALELSPWPAATATYAEIHTAARARLETATRQTVARNPELVDPKQIYGGIDAEYRVAPYASVLVSPERRRTLEVTGSFLPNLELAGASVHVFVDEVEVHTASVEPGSDFRWTIDIEAELAERKFVAVRFVSDDWALEDRELRTCTSFRLGSIAFLEG